MILVSSVSRFTQYSRETFQSVALDRLNSATLRHTTTSFDKLFDKPTGTQISEILVM